MYFVALCKKKLWLQWNFYLFVYNYLHMSLSLDYKYEILLLFVFDQQLSPGISFKVQIFRLHFWDILVVLCSDHSKCLTIPATPGAKQPNRIGTQPYPTHPKVSFDQKFLFLQQQKSSLSLYHFTHVLKQPTNGCHSLTPTLFISYFTSFIKGRFLCHLLFIHFVFGGFIEIIIIFC